MASEQIKISQKDVEAFSAKLEAWGQNLDAKEKALLHVLLNSAASGLPEETELSDKELEGVAGGLLSRSFDLRTSTVLSRYLSKGGLAAGGEVSEGGNPTVSRYLDPAALRAKTARY